MKIIYRLLLCSLPLLCGTPALTQATSDTFRLNVCNRFWKTGEPIPGMVLPDTAAAADTAGTCRQVLFSPAGSVDGYCPFGYKNDDWRNGVTIADFLLIWKHILGLKPITSPCLLKAADVHANGYMNAVDQIDIRRLVLGIYDSFPLNNSWQFVPETFDFYTESCPGFDYHPDSVAGHMTLCAVKTGDLDGDVNLHGPYVIPPNSGLPLSFDGGMADTGDTLWLPVRLAADGQIAAMQFGIRVDTSRCSLLQVRGGNYTWPNEFMATFPAAVHLAWVNPDVLPHSFSAGDVLMEVQVAARQAFDASQVLDLDQSFVPALWVDADDAVHPFADSVVLTGHPEPAAGLLHVSKPAPNPFEDHTFIDLDLDSATTVSLETVDLTGRRLWQKKQYLLPGKHRLEITGESIPAGGVAFYRLWSDDGHTASGRIVRRTGF